MPNTPDPEALAQLNEQLAALTSELARAQAYHRLILDSAVDYAIIAADLTGRIVEWNEGAVRLTGWSPEDAIGQPIQMVFTDADRRNAVVEREIGLSLSQGRATDDRWHLSKDGSTFWASGLMMPITESGQFIGVLKVIRDMTAMRDAKLSQEQAIRSAEKRFASLANAMPQLVWTTDAQGKELWFNSRWESLVGLSNDALINRGWTTMIREDQQADVLSRLEQSFFQARAFEETFAMRDREGVFRWFLARAVPILDEEGALVQWFGTCTDIDAFQIEYDRQRVRSSDLNEANEQQAADIVVSEQNLLDETTARRAAEGQVRQLQKMEAVGQLTGGIAHDFNNMLTAVIAGLDLLKLRKDRGAVEIDRYCDIALDGAQRAAALTRRLLAFARQQPLAPSPVNLNRVTAGLADMLTRTLGDSVRLESVQHAGLWFTYADVSQLENCIVNLAINARDAMSEGGHLTIETGNIYLDEQYADTHSTKPGQYAMLAVSDTGTGISPEHLDRIFEPYFTTKGLGKGTGLGLSQVYGFVKQSAGHINVYSEMGAGTTVKLYFPRYFGDTSSTPAHTESAVQPESLMAKSGERILVVEDDATVRDLSTEALRVLGYDVLEAENGAHALKLLETNVVSLMFTDVMMPDMTGRVLADKANVLYPNMRVVYTTGYTRNAIVHNGVLDYGVNFLPKPFTVRELAKKIRGVLEG